MIYKILIITYTISVEQQFLNLKLEILLDIFENFTLYYRTRENKYT